MKVKFVNGFKIRNTIDPNFGGHYTRDYAAYIPRGEIWIEDYLRPELDLFLQVVKMEKKFFSQKKTFTELRNFLISEAKKNGFPPNFCMRTERKGKLKIIHVDGRIVRKYLDPYFVSGGHEFVYSYVPKNEIWIDARNYKEEQSFVIAHELFERRLMAKGRDYHSAHDFAIAEEKHHRRLAGVAQFITG